jgi:hypothetical protein
MQTTVEIQTKKRAPMSAESKVKMIATRKANKALKDAGQAVPDPKQKEKKTDAEKVANKAAGLAKRLATLAAKKATKDKRTLDSETVVTVESVGEGKVKKHTVIITLDGVVTRVNGYVHTVALGYARYLRELYIRDSEQFEAVTNAHGGAVDDESESGDESDDESDLESAV